MKRLSGFSLMEMMIVLTIVAIVAAASAPMINKKMVEETSSGASLWSETSNGIAYNLTGDNLTVNIGSGDVSIKSTHPRLRINNRVPSMGAAIQPHIAFGSGDGQNPFYLSAGVGANRNNIIFSTKHDENLNGNHTNSVVIGGDAVTSSSNSIAIGASAQVIQGADSGIAIGASAIVGPNGNDTVSGNDYAKSIAIGAGSRARKENAIAIGAGARATESNSIAIGAGAKAEYANSIAFGAGAQATANNEFVLGTTNHTVSIPGILDATSSSGTSDRRLKNVGEKFKSGLSEIKKLEVYNYTFKNDKKKTPRVGVIAQDLKKVFPNAVKKGGDGFLMIRNEDMFYALINAIKELDEMYTKLEKRISELEKQNQELLERIEALEKAK